MFIRISDLEVRQSQYDEVYQPGRIDFGPDLRQISPIEIKGRAEDFVANVVEDGGNLPTGTTVLIVAEGERGSLLVTKHEM